MGDDAPRFGRPTDPARGDRQSRLVENLLGHLGAFLMTYAVAFLLASVLAWAAGRFLSIGGGVGTGGVALVALGLTLAFYWYDRNGS